MASIGSDYLVGLSAAHRWHDPELTAEAPPPIDVQIKRTRELLTLADRLPSVEPARFRMQGFGYKADGKIVRACAAGWLPNLVPGTDLQHQDEQYCGLRFGAADDCFSSLRLYFQLSTSEVLSLFGIHERTAPEAAAVIGAFAETRMRQLDPSWRRAPIAKSAVRRAFDWLREAVAVRIPVPVRSR